jgi:hypothetical protein
MQEWRSAAPASPLFFKKTVQRSYASLWPSWVLLTPLQIGVADGARGHGFLRKKFRGKMERVAVRCMQGSAQGDMRKGSWTSGRRCMQGGAQRNICNGSWASG